MQRKIGIDCRMIGHSGIGIRIDSLVSALLENNKIYEIYLFGDPKRLQKFSGRATIIEHKAKIYGIRELLGHYKMSEMDILDIPHFNIPLLFIRKCIVTIHDVIPFKMKQYHNSLAKQIYLKGMLWFISKFAKKVIAVSELTKKDLVDCFSFSREKIQVIYNGVDTKLFQPQAKRNILSFRKKFSLPEKYFLTIGIGKEHKNVKFLIHALNEIWRNKKNSPPLVIAGAGGKPPEYLREELDNPENKIVIFPQIEGKELPLLYSGAYLFIYPSLYEGFGFPVVEAQATGCPVISSNASVLPEILRDSTYYFDPTDRENFLEAFRQVTKSDASRKKYVKKGLSNVKRFSWEKAAAAVFSAYSKF